MDFLQGKEFFVTSTEKLIDELKQDGLAEDTLRLLESIATLNHKKSDDFQQVYDWLTDALTGNTITVESGKLTEEQAKYAFYFLDALSDCVTMVV